MPKPITFARWLAGAYATVCSISLMGAAAADFLTHGGLWLEASATAHTADAHSTLFILSWVLASLISGWGAMNQAATAAE